MPSYLSRACPLFGAARAPSPACTQHSSPLRHGSRQAAAERGCVLPVPARDMARGAKRTCSPSSSCRRACAAGAAVCRCCSRTALRAAVLSQMGCTHGEDGVYSRGVMRRPPVSVIAAAILLAHLPAACSGPFKFTGSPPAHGLLQTTACGLSSASCPRPRRCVTWHRRAQICARPWGDGGGVLSASLVWRAAPHPV